MTDFERRLRAAMESAVANEQPPGNLVQQVQRRHRRHTARIATAGTAAVAVVAVLVPVGIGAIGHAPGPTGQHRPPTAPTVYVAYPNRNPSKLGAIIPISIATNRPGKPIRLPFNGEIASTLDGRTLYVATGKAVIPIKTATNKPGKSAHVAGFSRTITPIKTATNKPGKPIHVPIGVYPAVMAFTPDGKTA